MKTVADREVQWAWIPFPAFDVDGLYSVLALRQAVFVVEQDCAYLDTDGQDAGALHLLGRREGVVVAYLRAFPPGVVYPGAAAIGRVVTHADVRGTGLGRPLMREGLRRVAASWGEVPVKVSAQAHLRGYYESLGFVVCGPGYDEDGIPHLPMLHDPVRTRST